MEKRMKLKVKKLFPSLSPSSFVKECIWKQLVGFGDRIGRVFVSGYMREKKAWHVHNQGS